MLYCKNCGNTVGEQDRFCEKCSIRLDIAGNVMTTAQFAAEKTGGQFQPDTVAGEAPLLGYEVFGFRLVEEQCSLFGQTYYSGAKNEGDRAESALLRHGSFPSPDQYQKLRVEFSFDTAKTDAYLKQTADAAVEAIRGFRAACLEARLPCLVKRAECYYSEQYKKHHVFVHMEQAVPLLQHIKEHSMTVRDCVKLACEVIRQMGELYQRGTVYSGLGDDNVFIAQDGTVYLGPPEASVTARMLPGLDAGSQYRQLFVAPDAGPAGPDMAGCVYGAGMFLARLLNGYRHIYLNVYRQNEYPDYLAAEDSRKRMLPPSPPFFAQNAIGAAAVRACSPRETRFRSLEEFGRILENSLHYLSAEELDSMAVDYQALRAGSPLVVQPGTPRQQAPALPLQPDETAVQVSRNLERPEAPRRKKGWLVAVAVVVLVALLVFLYFFLRGRDRSWKTVEAGRAAVILSTWEETPCGLP